MSPDEIIDSRKHGLGIYARSHMLFIMPLLQVMAPLDSVMFPMFSRLANEPVRLRKATAQIMEIAAAIMLPVAIGCFFCANEVVHVLLGPKWVEAVPVTRAFAIVAITFPVSMVVNALLMATGRSDVLVKWEIFWLCVVLPSVALMLSGGPVGVATALGWTAFLTAPIHLYIAHRVASLDLREMWILVLRNIISVLLCGGAILATRPFTLGLPDVARALVFGFLIVIFHGLALYLFGTIGRIKELIQIARVERER
jgi:O-antigen/teichoic acid export membrane protein